MKQRLASRLLSILMVLSPVSTAYSASQPHSIISHRTRDGRFSTPCAPDSNTVDGNGCSIPFARLIALPEKYDGKIIGVTGFLISQNGRLTLFPTRESSEQYLNFESVYVGGPIPAILQPRLHRGFLAFVVGKFDAQFDGPGGSLGAFWKVLDITDNSRADALKRR